MRWTNGSDQTVIKRSENVVQIDVSLLDKPGSQTNNWRTKTRNRHKMYSNW